MLELRGGASRFCDGVSRRSFLRAGFLGVVGLGLGDLLRLRATGAGPSEGKGRRPRSVILIWMHGGPSHFETYDPKPEAPGEYRGPYGAIATNVPGIWISDRLPGHAAIMTSSPCSAASTTTTPTTGPPPTGC